MSGAGENQLGDQSTTCALGDPLPNLFGPESPLDYDKMYWRGLYFRMRTGSAMWDRDYCTLFQMTREGQDLSPFLQHARLPSMLKRLPKMDQGGGGPQQRWLWTWSWEALMLMASDPKRALEHMDTVNSSLFPSFNVIADCFLYLRAFHYPSWPRELRHRFELAAQKRLHPRNWVGKQTSGAAALIFFEFAADERVGRALYLIRLYGLKMGPSRAESIAVYRHLLSRSRTRLQPAIVRKVHAAVNRSGHIYDERLQQKELQIRLQTANVREVTYPLWEEEFKNLYEQSLEHPPVSRSPAQGTRHLLYRNFPRLSMDWPTTALRLIHESPTRALIMLEKSDKLPRYPFNMMSDCFLYLRAFHYPNMNGPDKKRFRRLVRRCLAPSRWLLVSPSDTGVRLYLQFASPQKVKEAFDYVLQHNISLGFDGMLYFMACFIHIEDSSSAMQVLERITTSFSPDQVDTEKLRGHCCNLLVLATQESASEDQPWNVAIWSRMLTMGITPDQSMLNVVLRASLKHHMRDLAWDALDRMRDEGYTPDSYTYVALFEDVSLREDLEQLDVLIGEIGPSLLQEKHITSKVLHVYLTHLFTREYTRAERTQLLSRMIELYGNAHDFSPLVDLGLLKSSVLESFDVAKPPPSKHALVLVISAFLKVRYETADILEIYNRFRHLVANGHPIFCDLAESDYIYNAFLMSLPETPRLLTAGVEIVRQMSESLPDTARVTTPDGDRPVNACQPTVQTWTILMSQFAVLGDGHHVWDIRDVMRQQGLKFNLVGWNIAIGIFASRRMFKDVEYALREMIADGIKPDKFTMRSINRLPDRGQILHIYDALDTLIAKDA
ncbi:hypothetical protein KEM56_006305 [Ascosphaera pollenicola]|nr:hypothetical protein KEM56_006305 [Ascosphaera pollenicola]